MDRFYYQNSIAGFLADSEDAILGALARNNTFDLVDLQRNAWLYEIRFLKNMLRSESSGQIVFEYSIPRLGKRIDVVLLLHGIVFVLEFKVGAEGYLRQDLRFQNLRKQLHRTRQNRQPHGVLIFPGSAPFSEAGERELMSVCAACVLTCR